jgi:DNA-binding IclR family transcriptional regulator
MPFGNHEATQPQDACAEATGFDRATTHRAVVSLERIGFVDRDPRSRTVRLGIYMFSLGAKTTRRFDVLSHAREAAATLAEQTGDTVFLQVRNKFDCVCVSIAGAGVIRSRRRR